MESQFKLFFIEPFDTILRPFAITTAYTNAGDYPRAEWFLVIPDDKISYFSKLTRLDVQSFKDNPIVLDESLMLNEVYEQVRVKLRLYLFEKHKVHDITEYYSTPRLIEDHPKALVHYWLRGECRDQILDIFRKTGCEPLRSFLQSISVLPSIELEDF